MTGVNLFHFLHAQYDQSDALIQVAKFQECSLRHRNDVLTLVEKIREEVEEEDQTEENVHPSIQKKEIEIKAETTAGNDE